jgi:glycosyltransferase involved in cell wall biosynthesis
MSLTILSVAYPFSPVAPDCPGGAEQVLAMIDRGLTETGHRSIVLACEGSRGYGKLMEVGRIPSLIDEAAKEAAWASYRSAIASCLAGSSIDVVHFHGHDFHHYLPDNGPPRLVTLHLPLDHYPTEALSRNDLHLHCVSRSQHESRPRGATFLDPIENAAPLTPPNMPPRKRQYALFLGRICPEKGVHLAIEAARIAGLPVIIAGRVFPYDYHLEYFDQKILPHLGKRCRFVGPVGPDRKRRLLAGAQCLLVPSLIAETSSLVAREALVCGTPVVAYPNGNLTEVVEHGRTGYLASGPEDMAKAIERCGRLDPEACRKVGLTRFSRNAMIKAYLTTYERIAG